jgi:NAD(P)-dependent dehydrogenase (short-subunit alcohol dehydrogenase family)
MESRPAARNRDQGRIIDLGGRRALVTGASRNIGLHVATALAEAGATGALIAQNEEKVQAAARELPSDPGEWQGYSVDLGCPKAISVAIREIQSSVGPIDILVNVAGVRPFERLSEISVEAWDHVYSVNVRAPFLLAQGFLPRMMEQGWGRIVNVSGLDAFWGKTNRAHVSSSKAALDGLSRCLAAESAEFGVTVNTLVPGVIDTVREPIDWWPNLDEFYASRLERIPMKRLGLASEVADVCLFLASDLSSYMTGQTVFVSGGAFPLVRR